MANLYVGIGQVSLYLRHCQSLKDKRQALKGVETKLRNLGFSVADCDFSDNIKQSVIGYSFVSGQAPSVEKALDEAEKLFWGLEILRQERDLFDYSELKNNEFEVPRDNPHEDP